MKTSVEPLEGNKVKLSVEVDEQEFERAIDAAFRKIAREVRVPGFRPGKAPRRLLEARLGAGVAREEALRDALPEYYAQAVKEHEVDVIAAPEIDITAGQDDGPVTFDAVVEIRPRVSVGGYDSLRVTLPSPLVADEDVDAHIDRLRDQFGELQSVDRPAHDGDHVSIDIKGSVDGEEQSGLTADDYLYEVGSGTVVEALDDNLRNAKVGDILEVAAPHPDPEQGEISFRVLVKDVKEKVLPAVTDEWANEASEFETVDELKADIRKRLGTMKKVQAAMALRERTAEALAELVEDELPEPLVGAEMQNRLQDLAMRLQAQGMDVGGYLQATGRSEEDFVAELRQAAEQSVRVDLALRAVVEAEEIEATEDDLDAEYEQVAQRVGQPASEVRRQFERAEQVAAVRSDLKKRKALEWLVEHVEIVDEAGEPIDRADLELTAEVGEDVVEGTSETESDRTGDNAPAEEPAGEGTE
jgi:trigger factor